MHLLIFLCYHLGSADLTNSSQELAYDWPSVLNGIFDLFTSDYWIETKSKGNTTENVEVSTQESTDDAYLNITGLTKKYGYQIKNYEVTTQDGYVLSIHRLLTQRNSSQTVVFLMHGILSSSDSWVLQGPESALAYILVDQGYDVWLGNARGNKYSHSHIIHTQKEDAYWNFSWEEIGIYDLPSMIDFVLDTTEQDNLYYVGHSQGTAFFVLTSMKPEYNRKVKTMFALSPVAFMTNARSPIVKMLSPAYGFLDYFLTSSLIGYSPSIELLNRLSSNLCKLFTKGCEEMFFVIVGDSKMINSSFLPVILGHFMDGSSTKQFLHYSQLYVSDRFCRFDYGVEKNMAMYGQKSPPNYDLNKVNVSVVLYYSESDILSEAIDVDRLGRALPNIKSTIKLSNYSHLDYLYAQNASKDIYLSIINYIIQSDDV